MDFIRLLGEGVRTGLKIRGIPTCRKTGELATTLWIPLTSFDQVQGIDVSIDGADGLIVFRRVDWWNSSDLETVRAAKWHSLEK